MSSAEKTYMLSRRKLDILENFKDDYVKKIDDSGFEQIRIDIQSKLAQGSMNE